MYALQIVSGIFSWFWSEYGIECYHLACGIFVQPYYAPRWSQEHWERDIVVDDDGLHNVGAAHCCVPQQRRASCTITMFFSPQTLVLFTTLCGVWYVSLILLKYT